MFQFVLNTVIKIYIIEKNDTYKYISYVGSLALIVRWEKNE